MAELLRNLVFACRLWRHTPWAGLGAILVLALGIGASAAMFSIVQGVLLRPLPLPESDRLVVVWKEEVQRSSARSRISPPGLRDVAGRRHLFDAVAGYYRGNLTLLGEPWPESIAVAHATSEFFSVLATQPRLGRSFTPEELSPGHPPVVILTEGLWRRRFGGRSDILEMSISLSGNSHRVVGVMPDQFAFPSQVEMWLPLPLDPSSAMSQSRDNAFLSVVARLADGVSLQTARDELAALSRGLVEAGGNAESAATWRFAAQSLQEVIVGGSRDLLWATFGAVVCLLLIACASVASLLLAKATARQGEIETRLALGADRWHLLRQLLVESLPLSLASGLLGSGLAMLAVGWFLPLLPSGLPGADRVVVDGGVLAFALALCLLTALLFALIPWLYTWRRRPGSSGAATGRHSGGLFEERLLAGLLVIEMALTFLLVGATGLLTQSFEKLSRVELGFEVEEVVTVDVPLPKGAYAEADRQRAFYRLLRSRLADLPGVRSLATTSGVPLGGRSWALPFVSQEDTVVGRTEAQLAEVRVVSPGYFSTLGIGLLQGRDFSESDTQTTAGVVVVDRQLAAHRWPNEPALGKKLHLGEIDEEAPWLEVIGVVDAVRHFGPQDPSSPHLYLPFPQYPLRSLQVVLKSALPISVLQDDLRREVASLDKSLPVLQVRAMSDMARQSLARSRFTLWLVKIFSLVTLLLVALGIYGVVAYSVRRKLKEIGIRAALGAAPADLRWLVWRRMGRLMLCGSLLGLALFYGFRRALESIVFGVQPLAWVGLVPPLLILACLVLIAPYLAMRRAHRLPPIQLLRHD